MHHRRRLLILAGGAETRNDKQLHTNFSKLSVIKAQFGSLINDVLPMICISYSLKLALGITISNSRNLLNYPTKIIIY